MNAPKDFVPDYLLLGHVVHDVTPQGPQLGGTVSYGAHTAAALGLRVGVLTSTRPGEPLLARLPPGAVVTNIPAEHSTMFENRYTDAGRVQTMYHRALTLKPHMLPPAWRSTPLVHFGPIAYEVDPAFSEAFENARICVTPQGWLRERAPDGRVHPVEWPDAERVLSQSVLTVISEEDIRHAPHLEERFAMLAPLLVVTRAARGGTVYREGTVHTFSAHHVDTEADPTGAGDIFAVALHIALARLGDVERALHFAAYIAGQSITRAGFASAPTPDEVAHAWRLAGDSTG